jgi:hypothetical protein
LADQVRRETNPIDTGAGRNSAIAPVNGIPAEPASDRASFDLEPEKRFKVPARGDPSLRKAPELL